MFTSKDIEVRTIMVVDCTEGRSLHVRNGELLLSTDVENKTLTKLPFQKILALFIIGDISITTPLIDKCRRYNIALSVVKSNLRPVYYWAESAEGNFLLRQKQFSFSKEDITVAKALVTNKITNHLQLLINTRKKDIQTLNAISACKNALGYIGNIREYKELMGIEGSSAKSFFLAYYQDFKWAGRRPRVKCDILNATLDIGYSILFNYIECFLRMFGFDVYVGVYHRLWYKRKSLVCDLMEPFRCIIDAQVRKSFNLGQFSLDDFEHFGDEYVLKYNKNREYHKIFFSALIPRKKDVFLYVQSYYRAFMQSRSSSGYPIFKF